MQIKVFDSANLAAQHVSGKICELVLSRPECNLGVATGRTMDALYHHLNEDYKRQKLDFSRCCAFALDEYVGLDKSDEQSYRHYLNFHLFERLNFNPKRTFLPNVYAPDLDMAGHAYEDLIKSYGGIDLQLLGIGVNGHIGLNEPGSALDSRTRLVALSSATRRSNQALFKQREVPLTAMTMGIGTILDSREVILLATGESKAEIIQRLVNGDVHSSVPASAIKLHKNAELVLDRESASLLS